MQRKSNGKSECKRRKECKKEKRRREKRMHGYILFELNNCKNSATISRALLKSVKSAVCTLDLPKNIGCFTHRSRPTAAPNLLRLT